MSLITDFKELFTDQELERHYHPENFEPEYDNDNLAAYSDEQLQDVLQGEDLIESDIL